jgi:hypothetical protein
LAGRDAVIRLSIVCPALICRFRERTLEELAKQARGLPVEVLALADNMTMPTGQKLNILYRAARGEYIAAIGDDSGVSSDYIERLLTETEEGGADVVSFLIEMTWDKRGDPPYKPASQGETYPTGFRPQSAIRAALVNGFEFPAVNAGEDTAFRKFLSSRDPSIIELDRVLYLWHYRSYKPEFGGEAYPPISEVGR